MLTVAQSVDVKDLKTYQQVYIYIIPIITNLMVINLMVVVARLYWFQQRLKSIGEWSKLDQCSL